MTPEQETCAHVWRVNFGFCSECFVRKLEWCRFTKVSVVRIVKKARAEYLGLPTNTGRSESDQEYISLSEIQLGLPTWYKGYVCEAYLVPDGKTPPNFMVNGS